MLYNINMEQFLTGNSWMLFIIMLWTLPWKGLALWKAAQRNDQKWFIVLLLLNTLAILDILYIYKFSKREKINS